MSSFCREETHKKTEMRGAESLPGMAYGKRTPGGSGGGGPASPVIGPWAGGQVEAGENVNHMWMWAYPLPGWPGATGSVLSLSWLPSVSWPYPSWAFPCLLAAIPVPRWLGSQFARADAISGSCKFMTGHETVKWG